MGAAEVTLLAQEFATSTIKRFKRKGQSLLNSSKIFQRLKCSNSICRRTINKTLRIKTWETLTGLTHQHPAKANEVIQSLEWPRRTEVGEYRCLTEWDKWTTFQAKVAWVKCHTRLDQEISQTSVSISDQHNLCTTIKITLERSTKGNYKAIRRATRCRVSNILVTVERHRWGNAK